MRPVPGAQSPPKGGKSPPQGGPAGSGDEVEELPSDGVQATGGRGCGWGGALGRLGQVGERMGGLARGLHIVQTLFAIRAGRD
jgi:hypothetical protein